LRGRNVKWYKSQLLIHQYHINQIFIALVDQQNYYDFLVPIISSIMFGFGSSCLPLINCSSRHHLLSPGSLFLCQRSSGAQSCNHFSSVPIFYLI
jgi:hypothetical protein